MSKITVNSAEELASHFPPPIPERLPMFANRKEAGQRLARALEGYRWQGPLILAISPGGVEVGLEVAKYLVGDFSILICRKLPLPDHPEIGFGAIAEDGSTYLHVDQVSNLAPELVSTIKKEQLNEIQKTTEAIKSKRELPEISGRTVILVTDGLAGGSTMKAAFLLCRKKRAAKIIIAVPVIGKKAMSELKWVADDVVALESPESVYEVAQAYDSWPEASEEDFLNFLVQWYNLSNRRRNEPR
jgi:putative phosphoribosyl transferase